MASKRRLCLAIAEAAGRDARAMAKLLGEYGSLGAALEEPEPVVRALVGIEPAWQSQAEVADEVESREGGDGRPHSDARVGRAVVTYVDNDYPAPLRELHDPPAALFVVGAAPRQALAALAARPLVAVVGARGPSRYGLEMATCLASALASAGVCVVSGMALGIDAAGQAAAVSGWKGDAPASVGVLGCGADVVYPRTNERVFAAMRREGLIVSEYGWGSPAWAWRFPARNRIIAGLSRAVVVVEGSDRSGSLTTAEFALDLGRDVLAVPGEAGRRLSGAPHRLLREGAHLCESADDVLSVLGLQSARETACETAGLGRGDARREQALAAILGALDREECTVDELAAETGLAAVEVMALASELEIEGLVGHAGGGRLRRIRGAAARRPSAPLRPSAPPRPSGPSRPPTSRRRAEVQDSLSPPANL